MGFDFEEILGDMDYEDAVDMAAEQLEELQEEEPVEEVSDEEETESGDVAVHGTEPLGGAGFMDGMSDNPVFD